MFWQDCGFLHILQLLRARETELLPSSLGGQSTVQGALIQPELTGIINKIGKNQQEAVAIWPSLAWFRLS